jgi:hypothetical protein
MYLKVGKTQKKKKEIVGDRNIYNHIKLYHYKRTHKIKKKEDFHKNVCFGPYVICIHFIKKNGKLSQGAHTMQIEISLRFSVFTT